LTLNSFYLKRLAVDFRFIVDWICCAVFLSIKSTTIRSKWSLDYVIAQCA